MKKIILNTLDKYLKINKSEEDKLDRLKQFLKNNSSEKITDWNNFEGHIVASAFVMSKSTRTFAVVFHDEFKVYIYPGGHIDNTDSTPLSAAKREVMEETGLKNLETYNVCDDELVDRKSVV